MLNNSKVSLIIPIHGESPFLDETLESVELIRYDELEVILVLDRASASATKVTEVFAKKNENRRIIKSLKPGISDALNLGIAKSSGAYIARLDSDDMIAPDRITKQVYEFQKDRDLILVGTQMILIDTLNRPIRRTAYPSGNQGIKKLIPIRNCIGHPTVMLKREFLDKVGGYRANFNGAEDLDLWMRLAPLGKFKNINEELTYYRISENQVSQSLRRNPGELEERVLAANTSTRKSRIKSIRKLWNFEANYRKGFIFGSFSLMSSFVTYPIGTFRFCKYGLILKLKSRKFTE